MTHYEKETIAKIQIAQLVTDDPLSDDFYYQIHSSLQRGDLSLQSDGSKLTGLTWQQSLLVSSTTTPASGKGNSVVLSNQMQQQMQKLIEGRKQKPKGTSLSLEGALGKISLNSVRNPKQLIQIQPSAGKDSHSVPEVSRLTGRKILRSIETVYSAVLTVEHMKRKGPPADEDINEWKASLQDNVMNVWKELHLNEPVPFSEQHPFLYFLSFAKGKKVLPRIIGLLAPEQILAMLTTILARAESLDVCNMPAGTIDEQIDLFITNVIPCLVAFVTEVPLHVVNACMRILLERHNMVWLARSKVGLAFLTMLLSRAEILKQGGGAAQGLALPSPEDLSLWFVYVWQFFAAMAVGATTIDHQRVLVTEVRTKVIETSRRGQRLAAEDPNGSSAKAISNVNLFLNALGLGIDASQLAAMDEEEQ
ncbi:topoisomerase II-associated protein PAT1 [Chytridium lagenaria]|nr:topoisomerase II-associated protein PAT1 [Chytridium lagenaria]